MTGEKAFTGAATVLLLILMGTPAVEPPPARYQGDAAAGVRYVDPHEIEALCRRLGTPPGRPPWDGPGKGCYAGGVMYLPNPCKGRGEQAQIECHELAHRNGWPGDHPEGR